MKDTLRIFIIAACILCCSKLLAQNETQKWYFGNKAGLDFSTNPPTVLTNGMMNTPEGCSSMADAAGNLLFYTDGLTIWNQNHTAMPNGMGLFGSGSTSQSGVIVKKPGSSNIYYVFTLTAGFGSLYYSEVDMTLSAGLGDVTSNKNILLAGNLTEHLTSVRHCNGTDIWVMAHDGNTSNTFRAWLVSATGVSTVPVLSSAGSTFSGYSIGCMKFSSTGTKLGFAVGGLSLIELFDFAPSTGIVSNPVALNMPVIVGYPYGVEFSPNDSKLYVKGNNVLAQWDLCVPAASLIAAAITTFTTNASIGSLQLASNGKIYVACAGQQYVGVINNPNVQGTACNYVYAGQSTAPKVCNAGLPNFITSLYKPVPAPFTHTVNCQYASFTAPPSPGTVTAGCSVTSNSIISTTWIFGEPSSATTNTSTLANPTHTYASSGTYTVKLALNYACSADTITLPVTIGSIPSVSVSGTFSICAGEKKVYTVSGANTYMWQNSSTSTTISLSPTLTSVYSVTGTAANSCKVTKTFTVNVFKCTDVNELGIIENENTLNIYPNPSTGDLYLETEKTIELSIYNSRGELVQKLSLEAGKHTLDISTFSTGIYSLRAKSDGHTKMIRLVKIVEK